MFHYKIRFVNKNAFAIVLVLLFGVIFSFLALSCWQQVSFFYDISLEREKFYKNYSLTQSLYEKVILLLKKDFYNIKNRLQKEKIINLDITSWLCSCIEKLNHDKDVYLIKMNLEAFLEIKLFEANKNKLYVKVFVKKDGYFLSSITCLISKIGSFNENLLFIEYYTLNNSF